MNSGSGGNGKWNIGSSGWFNPSPYSLNEWESLLIRVVCDRVESHQEPKERYIIQVWRETEYEKAERLARETRYKNEINYILWVSDVENSSQIAPLIHKNGKPFLYTKESLSLQLKNELRIKGSTRRSKSWQRRWDLKCGCGYEARSNETNFKEIIFRAHLAKERAVALSRFNEKLDDTPA